MSRTTQLLVLGLIAVIVGTFAILAGADGGAGGLVLLGLLLAVPGGVAVQVAVIGMGVKIGMDDHADRRDEMEADLLDGDPS